MELVLLLLCLAPGPARAASGPSAQALQQYRVLQANVDQAFLWQYLSKNKSKVGPAPGKIGGIGFRIIKATGRAMSYNCHYYLVRDPLVNAITSPKGNIFIYEGLSQLGLSDEETAAVLAHEVGHLARSHWLARLKRGVQASVLAKYAAKTYGRNSGQIAYLYQAMQNLQFDRQEEYEADAVGVQLLARAGYPPEAMSSVLGKIYAWQQEDPRRVPANPYLSTHPLMPDRIARVEQYARTLRAKVRPRRSF